MMRILVTGSTGLIGSALAKTLTASGYQITRLVRTPAQAGKGAILWDGSGGCTDREGLEGHDAAIHLAGENIAARRWTPKQKSRIRDSRVRGTQSLCRLLTGLQRPPGILLCASATGYYGDRGSEILREDSAPGKGFLSEVCCAWEAAAQSAVDRGLRVVHLRFGIILSRYGGSLPKMLFPFRMGTGGTLGNGCQYMSWIALDDAVAAIQHALKEEQLRGPVNVAAPHPVTNREFTKTLGRVLQRPTVFTVPAFAARLALGEMADALLLASTRVEPARLLATQFAFRHPDLESALRCLLDKPHAAARKIPG